MTACLREVVVVGGGTAGWMSASYLASVFRDSVQVTLVEANEIPKIGVGEATIPNLQRVFFDRLGIPEDDWMRECNGSLKAGIRFVNWRRAPQHEGDSEHFYHTFGLTPECDGVPISRYWALRRLEGETEPYDYACLPEPRMLDAKRSPRLLTSGRVTNYAWHFDANLIVEYLKKWSMQRQAVRHLVDHVDEVIKDERGFIRSLRLRSGVVLTGDLFVDCSGFRSLLMNGAMEEPFVDMSDYLLCDSAVAAAIPHDDERHGIEPYTSAIAMPDGWTWKIPMRGRFGSGYVFSSRCATLDEAADAFCRLWHLDPERVALNKIRFRVGRNRRSWVKNCVGIGLSSCFLEPLESTGLYFIYAAVHQLARHFPDMSFDPALQDSFNREIEFMFDDCRDFVQAHYLLAPRRDTRFWEANGRDLRVSDQMQMKMERYRAGLPINTLPPGTSDETYYSNFELEFRNFWTDHSYYCIFAGLGVAPRQTLPGVRYNRAWCEKAKRVMDGIGRRQAELAATAPSMYDFLQSLHGTATALDVTA